MQKIKLNLSHLTVGALAFICGVTISVFFKTEKNSIPNEDQSVYATIGDKSILGSQVLPTIKEDLRQIERNKYLLKKKAVTDLILEKQRLTGHNQVAAAGSEQPTGEYNKEEFTEFLRQRNLNFKKMSKKNQENTISNFKIYKQLQVRKDQEQNQVKNMKIEWRIPMTFLDQPVAVGKGFLAPLINGSSDRTLIVFANYHCAYCGEAFRKIKTLQEKFKDRVKLHFRFALNEPETSVVFLSAVATACANEQRKFAVFFKNMFEAVPMDPAQLFSIAEKSMLDKQQFENCMRSDSAKASVRKDIQDSKKLALDQSAVIFIDGHRMAIQEPMDNIEEVIFRHE